MKKALLYIVPLVLAWMLGAGMAAASDLIVAMPTPAVTAPPVCEAQGQPAEAAAVELFAAQPQPAAICPLIGCVDDDSCRRDRDCVAAPGGVCNLFCPTRGCCAYPSP
jgi:hypothetical protein